ncbi:MAG: SDR family oxidoreductase [Eubacterium sp.]|nr:SDR family oxidoreductase [Eubacterium sp.]
MKKAIVTGGESGIGRGLVKALAKDGYKIASSFYSDEKLAEIVKKEIEDEGGKITFFKADLSQKDAPRLFFEEAVACLGGLDLLVNNAAASIPESLQDLKEEHTDYILSLSLRAYIVLMHEAAAYMIKNKVKGNIVNIASTRGERAYPNAGIYEAAKAGLKQSIKCFALDVAPYGIRINSVAPGAIRVRTKKEIAAVKNPTVSDYYWKEAFRDVTPEEAESIPDFWDELGECIPLGRSGLPEDIANAVCFLASDKASYITGVTINVDGGLILAGMPEDGKNKWI